MLSEEVKKGFTANAKFAQKNDFQKIANFILRRTIAHLFHFTHVNNLDSIFSDGIRTRQYLEKESIAHHVTDKDRLDGFKESISFSVGEPNRLLLPEKSFQQNHELVILEVSANALLTQNFAAFPSNVASGYFQSEVITNSARYVGIRGLQGLFLNENLRREAKLSSEVPTDTQAELLFFENIDIQRIQRIHISGRFPTESREKIDALRVKFKLKQIEFSCECGLFERITGPFRRYNIGWENNG